MTAGKPRYPAVTGHDHGWRAALAGRGPVVRFTLYTPEGSVRRRLSFQSSPVRVALLLGAVALGAWQAVRLADSLWPGENKREPNRSTSRAAGQPEERRRTGSGEPGFAWPGTPLDARLADTPQRLSGRTAPSGGSTPDGASEPLTDDERAVEQPLADSMKRFVLDLEFNAGLPEPPQQNVVQPPAPWRPDPGDEGRPLPIIEEVEPRVGPASGGARVTIRGRNLRASQVMFGLAPARIIRAGPNAVTVEAPPASAGPVFIAVTNDDGSYAVAPAPFTYGK